MNSATRGDSFLLPDAIDAAELISIFGGVHSCCQDPPIDFSLCYYDSFDWRLDAAGLRLLHVTTAESGQLRLQSTDGEAVVEPVVSVAEPAWPADLPESELRVRVSILLEMRVLLPLAGLRIESAEFRLLNDDAKTVVRLQLLNLRCNSPDGETCELAPRLRLIPVRGYSAESQRVAHLLTNELAWPKASPCLFEEALAAVGRLPGDYSSKLKIALDPKQTALEAQREILHAQLLTIERNLSGARAGLDSEFLHDLRVATRRTRSALAQVKQVLPQPVVEEYKQRFARLGQITGPTRDLDVFLLELPSLRAALPQAMAADLYPLEVYLRKAQRAEQRRLKRRLGSPATLAMLQAWRAILDTPNMPGEPGALSSLPVDQLASQQIWRVYKKVRKAGRTIQPDSPAEALHQLRKDCKKLRYLIEFFSSLYPAKPLKRMLRILKDLLDCLGQFQDRDLQADWLRGLSTELDRSDSRVLMATGALIASLLRDQQHARQRFAACFARFDAAENRALYRRLFRVPGG